MIVKTEGIVLHALKYSETSVIAHIYTKDFGIGSYIMNNVRSKRSKMAYFQPFSQISFEAYKKENQELNRIKEIRFSKLLVSIYSDISKASLTQFLGEFLYKTIHSEEPNIELFTFIQTQIQILEETEKPADFHLHFLIKLMHYFGIFPENNYSGNMPYFDMTGGYFTDSESVESLSKEQSKLMHMLISETNLVIGKELRATILNILLQYYKIHVHNFGAIKSLDILKTIFH